MSKPWKRQRVVAPDPREQARLLLQSQGEMYDFEVDSDEDNDTLEAAQRAAIRARWGPGSSPIQLKTNDELIADVDKRTLTCTKGSRDPFARISTALLAFIVSWLDLPDHAVFRQLDCTSYATGKLLSSRCPVLDLTGVRPANMGAALRALLGTRPKTLRLLVPGPAVYMWRGLRGIESGVSIGPSPGAPCLQQFFGPWVEHLECEENEMFRVFGSLSGTARQYVRDGDFAREFGGALATCTNLQSFSWDRLPSAPPLHRISESSDVICHGLSETKVHTLRITGALVPSTMFTGSLPHLVDVFCSDVLVSHIPFIRKLSRRVAGVDSDDESKETKTSTATGHDGKRCLRTLSIVFLVEAGTQLKNNGLRDLDGTMCEQLSVRVGEDMLVEGPMQIQLDRWKPVSLPRTRRFESTNLYWLLLSLSVPTLAGLQAVALCTTRTFGSSADVPRAVHRALSIMHSLEQLQLVGMQICEDTVGLLTRVAFPHLRSVAFSASSLEVGSNAFVRLLQQLHQLDLEAIALRTADPTKPGVLDSVLETASGARRLRRLVLSHGNAVSWPLLKTIENVAFVSMRRTGMVAFDFLPGF